MIFASLNFNPLFGGPAEGLDSYYGPRINNKAHINKLQSGFRIDARNVRLDKRYGVHITAVRPDLSYTECVWPAIVETGKVLDLAYDLVSRVSTL